MIAALLGAAAAAALAAAPVPEETACVADAASLVAEARELLAGSGPEPPPEVLANARRLLRSARREDASPALALEAADLAFAAGDDEEGGDLLAAAADAGPSALSAPELLLLGRRAEERRRWTEAIARYRDLERSLAASGEEAPWIAPRLRELELETEAESIAPPASGPPVEARLALADGQRALAAGRLREARASLQTAVRLAPGYVEALLALAAVETRAGRPAAAIRAGRQALAAEPDRAETMILLANLLWAQPDRAAKRESLALLDRAAALRGDLRALLRLSAERWAEFGDAPRAQERLDRYLARATRAEREAAAPLRESLAHRPDDRAPAPPPAPTPEEPASAAVGRWRKAQVQAARGDADSLTAALALLAEAEALDPTFGRAPELEAAIRERRAEWKEAEEALGRAIRADPSRATNYESLARLLERDPARAADAGRAWEKAAQAGSAEALFPLAQAAERAGKTSEALRLYARYRAEAPAGLNAKEAEAAGRRLEAGRTARLAGAASAAALVLAGAAGAAWRRRTGLSLEEWLSRHPERAAEARRVVGRLRHDALKHGGMLLSDGADRMEGGDAAARRDTAALLVDRLYGGGESRGLVEEVERSVTALRSLARSDRIRLDLARKDPVFAELLAGKRAIRRSKADLRRLASGAAAAPESEARRVVRRLRGAARHWQLASGAEIERAIDRAATLPVRLDALQALLSRVADEAGAAAPPLEILAPEPPADGLPPVRLSATDWEALWRNLFGNALSAGRLGLSAFEGRDPSTGEPRLSLVLFDDLPEPLSAEELRARPPDRGLGVVAEILRRSEGSIAVVASEGPGFTKGIRIELPAVEGPR